MSQTIGGRDGHLVFFFDRPEKPKLGRGRWVLASCKVLANFVQRLQRKGRKCLSQSKAGVTIMFFSIGSKNTNMVDDVEFLLPVKFQQIPFSGFREKDENVPVNQRPGRPSCFSDRLKKSQTWERTLSSCFLSSFSKFRSVVSEKKSKMSQQIRGRGGHLVFPIGSNNTNLLEGVEFLRLSSFGKFRSAVAEKKIENVSANQRPAWEVILFFRSARKTKIWQKTLSSCFLSSFSNFRSAVSEKKSKMSQSNRGRGGHQVFPISPKNTNLVEGVEFLLSVKFRQILFSGFREVENVSTNQRSGGHIVFQSTRITQNW